MRRALRGDGAVSAVVGGIVVLAILGISIAVVNGVHVPRQAAALEAAAHERAEGAVSALAAQLASPVEEGPRTWIAPLRPDAPPPPLLGGIVLTPARHDGRLSLDEGARISVSQVVSGGAGDPDDPTREALGGGRARVWLLGNRDGGVPAGAVSLRPGAAQMEPVAYRTELGATFAARERGTTLLEGIGLDVARAGAGNAATTTVSWRIPLVSGSGETAGGASALLRLEPGPASRAQGLAHELTVRVETDAADAWRLALEQALGGHGTVATEPGAVVATILPPPGQGGNAPRVSFDLQVARHEAHVTSRSAS